FSPLSCTAPSITQTCTLSLHDALPICPPAGWRAAGARPSHGLRSTAWGSHPCARVTPCGSASSRRRRAPTTAGSEATAPAVLSRSDEHTSELQSRGHLVCRLLLEKKKQ